jgi:hypothetical protein
MSRYEEHSTVLTYEEFEREDGQTQKDAGETVPDAEDADSHNTMSGGSPPIGLLWSDFRQRTFADAERIVFGLRRGNVGMLVAETNVGKTTVALNVSLTLAAGRTFPPFITEPRILRVMFIDGESTRAEIQQDINLMMREFSDAERALVDRNLLVLCEEELEAELLNLANPNHLKMVRGAVREFSPDLIVVDTMAALFNLNEENSNTEVKSVVMQPLKTLARESNGGVLLNHHIGKPKSEEGSTTAHAYKGRGASNFGALARSVVTLMADRSDKGRIVLSVPKAKGYRLKDVVMRLDDDARWFRVTDETPPTSTTCLQAVLAFVTRTMSTGGIAKGLAGQYSRSAVEAALKDAVKRGLLNRPKQGQYEPTETTQTTDTYSEYGTVETDNNAVC